MDILCGCRIILKNRIPKINYIKKRADIIMKGIVVSIDGGEYGYPLFIDFESKSLEIQSSPKNVNNTVMVIEKFDMSKHHVFLPKGYIDANKKGVLDVDVLIKVILLPSLEIKSATEIMENHRNNLLFPWVNKLKD